jgi:hypothetical protein
VCSTIPTAVKQFRIMSCFLRRSAALAIAFVSLVSPARAENHHYSLRYDLALKPVEQRADVSLTLDNRIRGNLTSLRFHIDSERHEDFHGDGAVEIEGDYISWTPPETGGRLAYRVPVDHQRPNGRFDALMRDDWAVFRGDDLFPPAETLDHDESEADTTLHVQLPERWSFVSPYQSTGTDTYAVEHDHRRFERPTGWMAAGRLGVRRERISGVHVVVAGPLNQGVRRLDMVALLNWNLPRVRRLVPTMPKRIVIVSAGDPMWRGGLSGPSSLFLHADRPLLSENGSSTLVHELIHVATRLEAEKGADWIVEGLAEYYSLKIMWRSGTLTKHRYQETFETLADWAKEADRLNVELSHGPVTARAVGVMRKLDHEIYKATDHEKSLDDVVRLLVAKQQKVSTDRLRKAVDEVAGVEAKALSDRQLGIGIEAKGDES